MNMHSRYDNMHRSDTNYAKKYINNHVISSINYMLSRRRRRWGKKREVKKKRTNKRMNKRGRRRMVQRGERGRRNGNFSHHLREKEGDSLFLPCARSQQIGREGNS